jgi:bifunctional pyridoxal-dependent enzyme with beta-cystathionase and maltose regulon repressor activities
MAARAFPRPSLAGRLQVTTTGYEYTRSNTLEEQAQWVVQAYQWSKQQGWVGPMFLWNLDYGVTAAGTELANFGILNTPAYGALAGMAK